MALFLFLACMLNFFFLGGRGLLMASKLKQLIGYNGSTLSLYYTIQNRVFSNSNTLVNETNAEALTLLIQCKQNIRVMFAIGFACIVASIPFA
ncbi:hypothetical protein A6K25_01880 [Alteromonas stellipolaris]|nr:hypothetical protein A6K25_01880 [Alteromonas stellipolaris]